MFLWYENKGSSNKRKIDNWTLQQSEMFVLQRALSIMWKDNPLNARIECVFISHMSVKRPLSKYLTNWLNSTIERQHKYKIDKGSTYTFLQRAYRNGQ